MDGQSFSPAAPPEARRKVRKGTHSCWECRRRKIRCLFNASGDEGTCLPCQARGSVCRSQEFADDTPSRRPPDTRLSQRLTRLEELMSKLVDRTDGSGFHGLSLGSHSGGSPSVSDDAGLDADDQLQDLSLTEETPMSMLLGVRSMAEQPPPMAMAMLAAPTPESDHESSRRSAAGGSIAPPRRERTSRALHRLFPSQQDVHLLVHAIPTPYFLTAMFKSDREIRQGHAENPELMSVIPPVGSHPTVLAKRLLQLAICIQHHPLGFDMQRLQMKTTPRDLMFNILTAVSRKVASDEDVIGTGEGLETLVLLGFWHANAGNLRKAWLSLRRAMSVGQLMGIDRGSADSIRFVDPALSTEKQPKPHAIWFRIIAMEHSLSLVLGLPVGCTDSDFASEEAMEHDTPAEQIGKLHTVICQRILERNAKKTGDPYALTQDIARELDAAALRAPQEWWLLPDQEFPHAMDPHDLVRDAHRLQLQVRHFDLRIMLHLPYMLQNNNGNATASDRRFDHSRAVCAQASRETLKRFVFLRDRVHTAWACRHIDYSALVAAMTLLLSYLDQPQHDTPQCPPQHSEDRKLVEHVRERMQHVAVINQDRLSHEASDVIGRLLPILDSAEASLVGCSSNAAGWDGRSRCVHIDVPYLGSVNIHPVFDLPDGSNDASSDHVCAAPESHGAGAGYAGFAHLPQLNTMTPPQEPIQMDFGPVDPSLGIGGVVHHQSAGYTMEFSPRTQRSMMELPLVAEASDWTFQGVDTSYWSLLNQGGIRLG